MPVYRGYKIYKPVGGIGYKIYGLSGSFKTIKAAKDRINREVRAYGPGIAGRHKKGPRPKKHK